MNTFLASKKNFNRISVATSLALALSAGNAIADNKTISEENKAGLKGAAIFTTASVVGAIAAGPVGFMLGAASGIYLGEHQKAAVQNKQELTKAENTLSSMRAEASIREQKISRLEKSAASTLEFLVLFPTGNDKLSHQDTQRLNSLSNYMKDNPELRVRLDGHADPRGTDEYNNVLSEERALSVVKALEQRGIEKSRIDYFAHGSSLSSAYNGDLEAYALERKVRIEIYSNAEQQNVATN